jgi:TonB-linked SusC/RagA family outer membrane protein
MTKVIYFFIVGAIAAFFLFIPESAGQNGGVKISGRVVDDRTGEGIIGAGISLSGAKGVGTVSDIEGNFSLTVNGLPAALGIDFLGYRKAEVEVYDAKEAIVVRLRENLNLLGEVVVVGYGTQRRKELTGAVTSVSKDVLAIPAVSLNNLLGGAVAGLNISEGGQPGSSFSVRIRGGNSINASNEPLYVVDGVILYGSSSTNAGVSQVKDNINPLAAISPNDIESIQVLKDVSATAIYGARGSNGVIIISTKNGQKGKDRVDYRYTAGWQRASRTLELLDGKEWAALNRELGGALKDLSDEEISAFGKGYDWQGEGLRTAFSQSHQISFSGGDERTKYALSGNFTDQDGILLNTDFKRYTGRVNLEREVGKSLRLSLNINASKLNQNGLNNYSGYAGYDNSLEAILRTSPLNPIYEGSGFNYHNKYEKGDLVKGNVTTNAVSDLVNTYAQNISDNLLASFSAAYSIIPELELKIAAGTNITNATQNYYAPSFTAGGFTPHGSAKVGHKRTEVRQLEYTLNYTKQVNRDNYLSFLGGFTTQTTASQYATAAATNFANEQVLWYSLQSGKTREVASSGGAEAVLNSFISRINYTFKERYNLTATFRADGSSRFAENNKWGFFPSLGASWNIHEEAFLKNIRALNDLKLRVSTGTVGNQEIGDYKYEALYGTTNPNDGNRNQIYSFGEEFAIGYLRTNLENPDLKWEQTTAYNAGVDASLFDYRLNLSIDAYYKKTSDLLLNMPTPITTGFNSMLRNIGNISNKGIEVEANATPISLGSFKWTLSGNIARNINKVLRLAGDQKNVGNSTWVGFPLGAHYLIQYSGIIQTKEDGDAAAVPSWIKGKSRLEPGDESFVDLNHDNIIDETNDRLILGSSTPDITYGFGTVISYKGVSLSASFQGVSGNKIYNTLRQRLELPNTSNNMLATLKDRWTPDNHSTAIPKAAVTSAAYRTSRYLEDGAYLRLKNVTVNYSLPLKLQAAPGARAMVFLTGQNLLTFTKFTGYDPETGGDFDYPVARSISVGINLSF